MTDLTDAERAMLTLERSWFAHAGNKAQRILDDFGISSTTYYQRLNKLIDTEGALAFDALTVNRLRALRKKRQRSRRL